MRQIWRWMGVWLLAIFLCGVARAEAQYVAVPKVEAFGKKFAEAVVAHDVKKMREFFHPAFLATLSKPEMKSEREQFETFLNNISGIMTEPYWVKVRKIAPTDKVVTDFHWVATPAYQIVIQAYHHDPNNSGAYVGGNSFDNYVSEKGEKLYLLRPLPGK